MTSHDTRREPVRILVVGGMFNTEGGRPSSYVTKLADALQATPSSAIVTLFNGGSLDSLTNIRPLIRTVEVVLWWPDIPNDVPKSVNDIKKDFPHTVLVTSKRNLEGEYGLPQLVSRALAAHANLVVSFESAAGKPPFTGRVIDPLGNQWALTKNIPALAQALITRLTTLLTSPRQGTLRRDTAFPEILPQPPDFDTYIEIVKSAADTFHNLLQPAEGQRFLGNTSFRCRFGFPSVRAGTLVMVSRRNVDKRIMGWEAFVPVRADGPDLIYKGDHKPSVDSPVQVRLYNQFPNINWMLHGHVYVKDTLRTDEVLPCGSLNEIAAVGKLVDPSLHFQAVNLKGHGCLLLARTAHDMKAGYANLAFERRPVPEIA